MLTEHFIASVGAATKAQNTGVAKDAAIFVHEFQPQATQRSVFKKSATAPNCLAVSESHIFAAQAEKAVVHVYNREKGNQEAVVPFTERITCIALACNDGVLVLGTAEGRVFLWETCTGRLVTTAQSHLQAVTVLAVDPTSNFLLSASADSTVHVWSIPSLLSFSNIGTQALAPISTFTSHRSEVTALAVGHSSSFCNIAVSASKDKTCVVWDYHINSALRTYLLPAMPTCSILDPADRAVYLGYEDGSIQVLDLYATQTSLASELHNGNDTAPLQSSPSSRLKAPDGAHGAALSITLSFDGTTLLTGHEDGSVLRWDLARGLFHGSHLQSPLPGPVSTLSFLPVTGFSPASEARIKIPAIVKPKFGVFDAVDGLVPANYTLNVELTDEGTSEASAFTHELTASTFSTALLDEGLSELATWHKQPLTRTDENDGEKTDDFMVLDDEQARPRQLTLEEQNQVLKQQIDALRRLQSVSFDKLEKINAERKALLQREQMRLTKRGKQNGPHSLKMNGSTNHENAEEDEEMLDTSDDD